MTRRIFLSAVSSEFKDAREHLCHDLQELELGVSEQDYFPNAGTTLLGLLNHLVVQCDAVIHLVGRFSGIAPRPAEVEQILFECSEFLTRFPGLEPHVNQMSYTQWEAWLAQYHRKPLHVYVHAPETPLAFDEGQTMHFRLIREQGLQRSEFDNRETLRTRVLKDLQQLFPERRFWLPNNLPSRSLGTLFKGRDPFLEQLHSRLQGDLTNPVGVLAAQCIHGLGGVGKTRVAIEYAWMHRNELSALLFVQADSVTSLERSLAELGTSLVLDLTAAQQLTEQNLRMVAAIRWLQTNSNWLMIVDSVDDEDTAKAVQMLVSKLTNGKILITSRLAVWGAGIETMPLNTLSPEQGRDYLLERTAGKRQSATDDPTRASTIAKDLGGLALALEQAGAYVAELRISLATYQRRWEVNRQKILGHPLADYPSPLTITWETTFARLSRAEILLLEHLALLAPSPIPSLLFDGPHLESAWEQLLAGTDVRVALATLRRYSLVTFDPSGRTPSEVIHRLVQDVVRNRTLAEHRDQRVVGLLSILDSLQIGDPQDVRSWPSWNSIASHWHAVVLVADDLGVTDPTARMMNNLGVFFKSQRLLIEAERLMRRAIAIGERHMGADHPDIAVWLCNLGALLQDQDKLKEAEPLLRRSLQIAESHYGPAHPTVGVFLNNVSRLLFSMNRIDEAETFLQRAISIGKSQLSVGDPTSVVWTGNFAVLLYRRKRYADAELLLRECIALTEKIYGQQHPCVADNLVNLAILLQDTSRHTEAEQLLRRALASFEDNYEAEHPKVAWALNSLGLLLQATNRMADAEPLMRRALAIVEHAYGPDHRIVGVGLGNLGELFRAMNRLEEAEPLLRRALSITEMSCGTDDTSVAIVLNSLGQLLHAAGRLTEAEASLRRAMAINRSRNGKDDTDVATNSNNLAQVLRDSSRFEEAERLLRDASAIDELCYGPDHPKVARHLNTLADLLLDTDRPAEAELAARRALAINERCYGPEHPDVARSLSLVAICLWNTNRFAEAERLLRRTLEIDETGYGPDHMIVACDLDNLGQLLRVESCLEEAEAMLRRSVAIAERSHGTVHPRVATCVGHLAQVMQDKGESSEAEKLFRRALEIDEQCYGPVHPNVARDLCNVVVVLRAMGRLRESEARMQRAVTILVEVSNAAGFRHPRLLDVCSSYLSLLEAFDVPEAERRQRLLDTGIDLSWLQ